MVCIYQVPFLQSTIYTMQHNGFFIYSMPEFAEMEGKCGIDRIQVWNRLLTDANLECQVRVNIHMLYIYLHKLCMKPVKVLAKF